MRLSDAIAMGRVLVKPLRGSVWDSKSGSGCALGMAGRAIGAKEPDYTDLAKAWPWSCGFELDPKFKLPCACASRLSAAGASCCDGMQGVIVHLFDLHVMEYKDWTLDQLIDWVRANEPPEVEVSLVEEIHQETPTLQMATVLG